MTIEEANKEFALISIGNKPVVMQFAPNGEIREFWTYEDFKKLLIKHFIKVKRGNTIKTVPFAGFWLTHPQGRSYDRLVYAMPGSKQLAGPRDYNGWQGFSVEPKEGCWELNKAHVRDVICSGNEEHFEWVMNWLAALIQLPGKHAETCIVLQGGQGTGKGHFVNAMVGSLFGPQQYIHVTGANQLTAEFNEHLSGKCLVFADESTWGGDPKAASKLKSLITEDTNTIHRKFLKMIEEESHLHIFIASNNEWPIPIEHDDRRSTVFLVSDAFKQNTEYFGRLHVELASGGRAAMLYELLNYQIDEAKLRTVIRTAAKTQIAMHSMKPIEHWWQEVLSTGVLVEGTWPASIAKRALHDNYLDFLDRHHKAGRDRRSTETEMGMFLRKVSPVTQRLNVNGTRERMVVLPPLEDCRIRWAEEFNWGAEYQWDNEDVIENLPHEKHGLDF